MEPLVRVFRHYFLVIRDCLLKFGYRRFFWSIILACLPALFVFLAGLFSSLFACCLWLCCFNNLILHQLTRDKPPPTLQFFSFSVDWDELIWLVFFFFFFFFFWFPLFLHCHASLLIISPRLQALDRFGQLRVCKYRVFMNSKCFTLPSPSRLRSLLHCSFFKNSRCWDSL